ncbi:MAG: rhomboid family intramembrane serine protease [Chlamydiales bacterium]|nr:rhomboid family intramembrane serine protease [Chlamydiales bacterium]
MSTYSNDLRSFDAPKNLKTLIIITAVTSLLSVLLTPLFQKYLQLPGPQYYLSLSASGLLDLMIWQPFTYIFVQKAPQGIDFNFIIHLVFNTYLLWVLGSSICNEIGEKTFFRFYFYLSALTGCLLSLAIIGLGLNGSLASNTSSLIGLLIIWSMLYPEMEVLLFMTFPVKVKYLAAVWLLASILINLSSGNLVPVFAYSFSSTIAYSFGVLSLNLDSPFESLHFLDRFMRKGLSWPKTSSTSSPYEGPQQYENQKIVSIEPQLEQETEADDIFIDRMLAKISKEGKASLSWEERTRLRRISKKSPKNFDL